MNLQKLLRAIRAPWLFGLLVLVTALALGACGDSGASSEPVDPPAGGDSSSLQAQVETAYHQQAAGLSFRHHWRKHADLSRLVIVGDSLGATQNSCMLAEQTVNLYPSLIAEQAGVPMPVPLIDEPGFPSCITLDGDAGPLPDNILTLRLNPGVPVFNLSVPATHVAGALDPAADVAFFSNPELFGGTYPYLGNHLLALSLSDPGFNPADPLGRSMVDWAIDLQPTTMIVWLGSNDVLWSALAADPQFITGYEDGTVDVSVFIRDYVRLMTTLRRNTDADMVVANIPDVTVIPYLTPAPQMLAGVSEQTGLPVEFLFAVLGLSPDDYLTPDAPDAIGAVLVGAIPALPGGVVFTADELAITRKATNAFNAVIGITAWLMNIPVVDIHGLLDEVDAEGYAVGDNVVTTEFLGGVFTLDGIHPTNTGHAVVANEFIRVLNRRYGAAIPPVDVEAVYATDPLIFP